MKILVMGAGAIGSFFGGLLSKENNVVLIGRKPHVDMINKKGLKIKGKTKFNCKLRAFYSTDNISDDFDLILLTVKSYDTEKAVNQIKHFVSEKTIVLSLQNGLDNLKKITKYFSRETVFAGVTSNGVIFEKPGIINHTGVGYTFLGSVSAKNKDKLRKIAKFFNKSGIKTSISPDITEDIWVKGIINSSINPLTTFFKCKNGYLIENPVLKNLVKKICFESTNIAKTQTLELNFDDMIDKTFSVIKDTKDNYSSMLQSYLSKKAFEIDSINGVLADIGKKENVDTTLNEILIFSVKQILC